VQYQRNLFEKVNMATHVVFKAEMVCGGCSGAIERILNKLENVDSVECDLDAQKVTVKGKDLDAQEMLKKLEKWGAAANKQVSIAE